MIDSCTRQADIPPARPRERSSHRRATRRRNPPQSPELLVTLSRCPRQTTTSVARATASSSAVNGTSSWVAMMSARAVATAARVATHGITCRVLPPCQCQGKHNEPNQHRRGEHRRQHLKTHGGFPQQRREDQCRRDCVGDAGKVIGGVSPDCPDQPHARVHDGEHQHRQLRDGSRLSYRAQQVCAGNSQNCLAEHGHPGGHVWCRETHATSREAAVWAWADALRCRGRTLNLRLTLQCGNPAFQFPHSFIELFHIRCDSAR